MSLHFFFIWPCTFAYQLFRYANQLRQAKKREKKPIDGLEFSDRREQIWPDAFKSVCKTGED